MVKQLPYLFITALIISLILVGCRRASPISGAELMPLIKEDPRTGLVKWGYARLEYDENGYAIPQYRYIIKPRFAAAEYFSEELALVNIGGMALDGSAVKGGEWAYINYKGEVVIRGFKKFASSFSEGLAAVQLDENDLRGYIDTNGVMIIPPQFIIADDFSEGLAAVRPKNNANFGYINQAGVMIIPPNFDVAEAFKCGVARVILGEAENYAEKFIDKNGNFVECK